MPRVRRPIPDKLVVLTFDDGAKSQLTVAGPLLAELGFGGTFFITEGLSIPRDKLLPEPERTHMTWPEVVRLHEMGRGRFDIGNHTEHHASVVGMSSAELQAELRTIDARCAEHGLPRTATFCYPVRCLLALPPSRPSPAEIIHADVRAAGDGGRHEQRWVDGW
eukprot:COSAG04_NODE_2780_length_3594_cov_5.982546_4_plen_163_part_01